MESGATPHSSITAKSFRGSGYEPRFARLNGISGLGSWCSGTNEIEDFLQIDTGKMQVISSIATQGNAFRSEEHTSELQSRQISRMPSSA